MPYDVFNYIRRTLEKDFKTVVEIRFGSIYLVNFCDIHLGKYFLSKLLNLCSPVIWFVTVLFLLTNSDGNTHWLLPLKHTISLHHKTDIGYHLKQEYILTYDYHSYL